MNLTDALPELTDKLELAAGRYRRAVDNRSKRGIVSMMAAHAAQLSKGADDFELEHSQLEVVRVELDRSCTEVEWTAAQAAERLSEFFDWN